MNENQEILDSFESYSPSLERWYFYKVHLALVFLLIWGLALLDLQGWIDILPLDHSYPAIFGLVCLFFITIISYRLIWGMTWGYALLFGFFVFIVICFIMIWSIQGTSLDRRILPFYAEIIRLTFFSGGYGILSLLPLEIAFRYNSRRS